jgi:GH24 family phage-related lysozyme (muramidase)
MLISRITEHEGIKRFVYKDTLMNDTIGVGRCVQEGKGRGLTVDECFYLLRNDITYFTTELKDYDWFSNQDEVRQYALVELAFNMGVYHLLGFHDMLDALKRKSYNEAAKHLLDSAWTKQVGSVRATDLSYRISNGRYK